MRECGLKLFCFYLYVLNFLSLPMRECGLKQSFSFLTIQGKKVTPHAGVWIETLFYYVSTCYNTSLPMRECGLKRIQTELLFPIKQSLPMRECGLKQMIGKQMDTEIASHSPCGSVDWNIYSGFFSFMFSTVTPHAGVWIETIKLKAPCCSVCCHSPCGSVDWNTDVYPKDYFTIKSLPMRECGLKLVIVLWASLMAPSLPMRECGLKHKKESKHA